MGGMRRPGLNGSLGLLGIGAGVGEEHPDTFGAEGANDGQDVLLVGTEGHGRHVPVAGVQEFFQQLQVARKRRTGGAAAGHERAFEVQARNANLTDRRNCGDNFAQTVKGQFGRLRDDGRQHAGAAEAAELTGAFA